MPSTPPAEAPARCAKKIGTNGRTQGDEIESTPAKKAAIKETSTPMKQPYHRHLGAAIDRILPTVGNQCRGVCARGRGRRGRANCCQPRLTLQPVDWVVRRS